MTRWSDAGLITTLGEILVEIVAIERGGGFDGPMTLMGPFPSGAPAIFIDQVARFGAPAGIIGAVGDDDFGRLNRRRLADDGVDVSALLVHAGRATGSAFVRYRPDGQRDFVFNVRDSAAGLLAIGAEADALLARTGHLHLMGSSLFAPTVVSAALDAMARVKRRGGTVSFDPNMRKEMLGAPGLRDALRTVLAGADLFLPSGDELTLLTEADGEAEAIAALLSLGIGEIVVKRGAAGASFHDRDGRVDEPALVADEVDPTGAGDCFGAAFVASRRAGLGPRDSLRRANASGALAVEARGPMEGAATADAVARAMMTRRARA